MEIILSLLLGDEKGETSTKGKIRAEHYPPQMIFWLLSLASLLIHKSPGHPFLIPPFYSPHAIRWLVGDDHTCLRMSSLYLHNGSVTEKKSAPHFITCDTGTLLWCRRNRGSSVCWLLSIQTWVRQVSALGSQVFSGQVIPWTNTAHADDTPYPRPMNSLPRGAQTRSHFGLWQRGGRGMHDPPTKVTMGAHWS